MQPEPIMARPETDNDAPIATDCPHANESVTWTDSPVKTPEFTDKNAPMFADRATDS